MIKNALLFGLALGAMTLFMGFFVPFVLDQSDKETEWSNYRVAEYYSSEEQ